MSLGKRGQGGMSMEMLVGMLALAVILVLAILFFSGFFGSMSNSIDLFDVESMSAKMSCKTNLGFAKTDDAKFAEYCGSYVYPLKIGGKKSYATCAYLVSRGAKFLSEEDISTEVMNKCTSNVMNAFEYNKCFELNRTQDGKTNWVEYVNGVKCDKNFNSETFGSVTTNDGVKKEDSNDFYTITYSGLPSL